jgi:sulfite dehydrogenase
MLTKRQFLKRTGGLLTAGAGGTRLCSPSFAQAVMLPFANGERKLAKFPGKRPLIQLTERPPQLETPFSVFDESIITPNDAFFVRYHLAGVPLSIDPDTFRLEIGGTVDKALRFTLKDLKAMPHHEIIAVNQCSGNSRGFLTPRVPGGQLANGAMGNARWTGVLLRTLLNLAGVRPAAKQVVFEGLDGPVVPKTPDFVKALDVDHARDSEVMLAFSMNGEDIPWLNGYPLRLVVPGYYGTYWVKHLNKITVINSVLDNFWMKTAYRIPDNACACVPPGGTPNKTVPIGRFNVRSFITSVQNGSKIRAGETAVRGIAFDGGSGIKQVMLSIDSGKTWRGTMLGPDYGKYSFRPWQTRVKLATGSHTLMVRATNMSGEVQPMAANWNPSGYMRNVVETLTVSAA